MQVRWFNHLKSKEAQDEFKKYILNSAPLIDRLKEICYNSIKNGEKSSEIDYDSPSWSHKQADRNGYVRAFQEIYDLLDIKDH